MGCRRCALRVLVLTVSVLLSPYAARAACVVPDNGGGTVTLPPPGCAYLSPDEVHEIIDGLPAGTTIELAAIHQDIFCKEQNNVCSFPLAPGTCTQPGGSLGGEQECASSNLVLELTGTGALGGFARSISLPVDFETHVAPRTPFDPVQSFDTDMFRLQGQILGDPDFDLLRITAGTDFGLPSPGHTTLTQLPGGNWAVDSFFDITYRIDFVGAPGGPLAGMSGSTTGTIRMDTGGSAPCPGGVLDCDDGDPCTTDVCEPQVCLEPDNGTGTATLPPQSCGYVSPEDVHMIIDGLPPGSTLMLGARHAGFFNVTTFPGGSLGGDVELFNSSLDFRIEGTGALAGFHRTLSIQAASEAHTGPRTLGAPVQTFPNDMFRLQGQLPPGDPDFDLLRVQAGTAFGMPSPGQTTLTLQPGGNWAVDSFFDITYRIDFVGAPGGPLGGMSGSTTGTIRMVAAGSAICSHLPVVCDDGNPCTADSCDAASGGCVSVPVTCDDGDPCTVDSCDPTGPPDCTLPDAGGTVTLPPAGCSYVSPADLHEMIDGLPPGTTIQVSAEHADFFCPAGPPGVCSFSPPVPGSDCSQPGGNLGGEQECAGSNLRLHLTGTGMLAGFSRDLDLGVEFETHTGPRTPGAPVQDFDTDMFRLHGELFGDPDFDLLRITGGSDFGLPSPGHTTLTQLPGGNWAVDSFFDIVYRIDFVGSPAGQLGGMSGSTTGTIRMGTGSCTHAPVDCDDGNPCTVDSCNPATGACEQVPVDCDDGDPCTIDSCDPASGGCVHLPVCDDGDPCTVDSCLTTHAPACEVPDNGGGTVTLPPPGCDYLSPSDVHEIVDGLPPGTTIQLGAIHQDFICREGNQVCSFPIAPGAGCEQPGGSLGGSDECSSSVLGLQLTGTGMLAGYARTLSLPVDFETHTGPRTPGDPVQSFDTDMFRLRGQLFGDPDFDLLRITAGTDFGLPSPGHTTLTRLPSGNYTVDSFFDITYRIDFVGAPGGPLAGHSGSTTATIRMETGNGGCVHDPVDCDDGNPCTVDSCNPNTGECEHVAVDCDDNDPCTADFCDPASGGCVHSPICDDGDPCTVDSCLTTHAPACEVPDNGGGTVTLPPAGCDYLSPDEVHEIVDGLPPGTTIQLGAIHQDFICREGNQVCSFPILPPGGCEQPGGSLGGQDECASSVLGLQLTGTGMLGGYARTLNLQVDFETHTGPRVPGAPVQSFDTDMFRLFGQITGDPDFDLLRITAGTDFGLPSPGHTTLTQLPSGNFNVDSFFDITYRIDFVGAPGGPLAGHSGSTTGTIRMETGGGGCVHDPVDCDDANPCTVDSCNPNTGECEHVAVDCDDNDPCTVDYCDPDTGECVHLALCDDGDPCTVDSCVTTHAASACEVPDNGSGTVTLPPAGCEYLSPEEVHQIVDGLPAGTTIELAAIHKDFLCLGGAQGGACSFSPPIPGVDCTDSGGSLGGEKECSNSTLDLNVTGTGLLGGFARALSIPVSFETHTAPRTPGDPVQSFDTDMFRLFGQITGDPDFDLLRITAGTDFGLPSPGHTTLTRLPSGDFAVDSFFDITYRIDFVGAPGGALAGMSGSTTATIRMATGASGCVHEPLDCDDGVACTVDSCDPASGGCVHVGVPAGAVGHTVRFSSSSAVHWAPTSDATHWNAYRGTIPTGWSIYNHACHESGDSGGDGPTTTTDGGIPPVGTAYYYLVTAENPCGESSPGHASSGAVRPIPLPCPTPP